MDKKVRAYLTKLASRGGKARTSRLTKAERTALARKAARARWAKRTKGA